MSVSPQATTTQQVTFERAMFLKRFDRECECTLRVLNAYPKDQDDLRPHARSKTAKELAWMFAMEQGLAAMGLAGKIEFGNQMPSPPATFAETIPAFEKATAGTRESVAKASDEQLARLVSFPAGPGKMADVRAMDVLWMTLMDQVHHRGQFSVYLRMAGGKVPSIYGPSADEPWR